MQGIVQKLAENMINIESMKINKTLPEFDFLKPLKEMTRDQES